MKTLSFLGCLFLSSLVLAASPSEPKHASMYLGALISAKPLNGAASTLTFTVGPTLGDGRTALFGYSTITLDVDYTYSAGGVLVFTCTGTGIPVAASATRVPTTMTVAAGAATLNWSGVISTPTLSTDKSFYFPIGLNGTQAFKCVLSMSGAAAGDIVSVYGTLMADGGGR